MNLLGKQQEVLLTEEEQAFLTNAYNEQGIKNVSSLVSLLYARGNNHDFTPLKKSVADFLKIKDVFRSITDIPLLDGDIKES